jgi:ATP dependent DNA ligase domain
VLPLLFIKPCEPSSRDRLPKGDGWIYEVKFYGYRLQVHKTGDTVTLYTRRGADWTARFPTLAASLRSLPCRSAIIDAELVHAEGFASLHRLLHQRIEDDFALGQLISCSSTGMTSASCPSSIANDASDISSSEPASGPFTTRSPSRMGLVSLPSVKSAAWKASSQSTPTVFIVPDRRAPGSTSSARRTDVFNKQRS